MRKIEFKQDEIEVLFEIIKLGNFQYKNEFPEIGKLLFNKIRIDIFTFSTKEILVLKSYTSNWLNNNDDLINNLFEKYCLQKLINNFKIEQKEIEQMKKIEIVFSIKSKLFKEKFSAFKTVLENVAI